MLWVFFFLSCFFLPYNFNPPPPPPLPLGKKRRRRNKDQKKKKKKKDRSKEVNKQTAIFFFNHRQKEAKKQRNKQNKQTKKNKRKPDSINTVPCKRMLSRNSSRIAFLLLSRHLPVGRVLNTNY